MVDVKLDGELADAIAKYLATRPWGEVYVIQQQLITAINLANGV